MGTQWRPGPGQHLSLNLTPEWDLSPMPGSSPLPTFVNKVSLAHSTRIHLQIFYGLLHAKMASPIGLDQDSVAHRAIYYLALCRTRVMTLSPILQYPGLCLPPKGETPIS